MKIPQPTSNEMHSKQPYHLLKKLRVEHNFFHAAPIAWVVQQEMIAKENIVSLQVIVIYSFANNPPTLTAANHH
jgi:hypothetical protein